MMITFAFNITGFTVVDGADLYALLNDHHHPVITNRGGHHHEL